MKTIKPIYPLALALAATLVATGCKHKPVGLTPLPNGPTPVVSTPGPGNPLGPGSQAMGSSGAGSTEIPTAPLDYFEGMIKDRTALAPYTIHFAFDSAVIRSSDQANLQAVAQQLAAHPDCKLLIEGNCDERGTEEYNRALGERRALAAREALANLGVDPSRIRTISYGKDNPVDPGHNEAAWAKNRRDDFVLLHPKPGT